ncbi:MAG: phospho-N-acetylmuramoyl-pentapeptide-transferase [Clostridia bacterium]|nr:phospho-N-acetylmuramoyl-pentapeptide-transferase [Clostridia bacterium]
MAYRELILYFTVMLIAFGVSYASERAILPMLRRRASQPIYEGGPSWHSSKRGTPTMGGIAFIIGITLSLIVASIALLPMGGVSGEMLLVIPFTLLNAAVGIIDDWRKLSKHENLAGLKPWQKLLLQGLIAAAFLYARYLLDADTSLVFGSYTVDIGLWYYPLAFIAILGLINCANLTDGVDGLAGSVAFSWGILLPLLCSLPIGAEGIIGAATVGGVGAFLIFNLNPARVFMGDTGSLYLGSLLAAAVILMGNPLIAIFLGFVYALEGLSVILQVISFKLTGRRLFLMAPLHHHFEKRGMSENKICILGVLITLLAAIPVMLLFSGG